MTRHLEAIPRPSPLPVNTLGAHPSTDQVDAVVHELIDMHLEGRISESAVRNGLVEAIYKAGIHVEEAHKRTELSRQGRDDLADKLLMLIVEKAAVGTYYDLERGRSTSACGWARQLVKAAVASEMRNTRRSDNRNGAPVDPTSHGFTVMAHNDPAFIVTHESSKAVESSDLAESYVTMTRGLRDTDRIVVRATTLCHSEGVAPAVRPRLMTDRDWILRKITADPTLALRSLKAFKNLVCGTEIDNNLVENDPRLLALWDEQSDDSADALLRCSHEAAHTLALHAATPLPRPSKKAIATMRRLLFSASKQPDWRPIASALVDSFVASEFEPVSQYATMTLTAKNKAITGHVIARGRLDDLLNRAVTFHDSPIGKTADRVLDCLGDLSDYVVSMDPSKAQQTIRTLRAA